MYAVSNAFHEAVRNGNKQRALLLFENEVFTNEDIDVEGGIEFRDYFNLEENLSIGQTPSNEISFGLFNDDRLLNNDSFGEFLATIGVLISTETVTQEGKCKAVTAGGTWVGSENEPYLKKDGTSVSTQPGFPVRAIWACDGKVYAYSGNGQVKVYNDSTGADITSGTTVTAHMAARGAAWTGKGISYNRSTRMMSIIEGTVKENYEFCPLGIFIAERPNAPDKIVIDMTCYDLMQKFDTDWPDNGIGLTYPTTIGGLYAQLCTYIGVPYRTASFLNSGKAITSEPDDFEKVTCRTVLGWIAEAAGSNARIDRDGYVVLDWIRTGTAQSAVFDETMYSEYDPYWYETQRVSKLYNRDTSENTDATVGTGSSPYLIQDNPLLRGVNT